jgi:hypothetical protein
MGTKNNPGQFDCYEKAEPDEPMFVLLGRDPVASLLVRLWIEIRSKMAGTEQAILDEAERCAAAMELHALEKGKAAKMAAAVKVFDQMAMNSHTRRQFWSQEPFMPGDHVQISESHPVPAVCGKKGIVHHIAKDGWVYVTLVIDGHRGQWEMLHNFITRIAAPVQENL